MPGFRTRHGISTQHVVDAVRLLNVVVAVTVVEVVEPCFALVVELALLAALIVAVAVDETVLCSFVETTRVDLTSLVDSLAVCYVVVGEVFAVLTGRAVVAVGPWIAVAVVGRLIVVAAVCHAVDHWIVVAAVGPLIVVAAFRHSVVAAVFVALAVHVVVAVDHLTVVAAVSRVVVDLLVPQGLAVHSHNLTYVYA